MNKVIRRSYRKKIIEILKIHGVREKNPDICIHLGSYGASSSHNISLLSRCILPTAGDMKLFIIMVTVTPSKRRGKPSNSNIIFCCLSKLLIKWDIWVSSDGLQAIIFWHKLDQRDSKLSLKAGAIKGKMVDIFNTFCKKDKVHHQYL